MSITHSFILDSSVVLAEILNENRERLVKFKDDLKKKTIECYITCSVFRECEEKLDEIFDFTGDIIRKLNNRIRIARLSNKINIDDPIKIDDIKTFERFFIAFLEMKFPISKLTE